MVPIIFPYCALSRLILMIPLFPAHLIPICHPEDVEGAGGCPIDVLVLMVAAVLVLVVLGSLHFFIIPL